MRPRALYRGFMQETGGILTGFLLAVLVLAAVGVAAFFYFGGEADVDIKKPNVDVSSSSEPPG